MNSPLTRDAHSRSITAAQVLARVDAELGEDGGRSGRVWSTGFSPLDAHLGGGLHRGDLSLLAGGQGTGKTTMALQVARNVCIQGGSAVFVCYEHTPEQLLERLLVMESALEAGPSAPSQDEVRQRMLNGVDLVDALADLPGTAAALTAIQRYGDRLHLVVARGDVTGIEEIRDLVSAQQERGLVVVDYLQKVFAGDTSDEEARVARIATGLKDLALEMQCPVLAIAAADRVGLDAPRIRARHLKGSVSLAYEADSIVVLQNKYDVVARQHLVYDIAGAQHHHNWVVCTLEKNRHGQDHVELEFRMKLSHGHLDPHGRMVQDQLVDERLHAS